MSRELPHLLREFPATIPKGVVLLLCHHVRSNGIGHLSRIKKGYCRETLDTITRADHGVGARAQTPLRFATVTFVPPHK